MNLKVQKVDPYQFVNKNFTIAVVLPDNFPDISRRNSNLPLKVDVCFDEEVSQFDPLDRNYNPNLVDVVSNTNIDRSRRAVVTLRLKEPSANHNNKKFVIRFTALTLEGEVNSICGYSIPITVVRFKLKIQEEFADHGSYIWMKDVGGKDKSIDLQVGVVDNNDTFVMNRRVPLKVALLYASGVLVPQQDILQLSPDSQLLIGQGGFTRIKCRINEVSSRHQGQLFQILISPDYDLPSPLADISPARSVPVEVKSKINFSHKRKMQAMGDTSPTNGNGSGASSSNPAGVGGSSYHAALTTSAASAAAAEAEALEDSKLGILRSAYSSYDAFRARNFDNFNTAPVLPAGALSVAQLIKPSPYLGGAASLIQTSLSHTPNNHSSHTPHTAHASHASHPSSILPLSSVLSSSRALESGAVPAGSLAGSSVSSNPASGEENVNVPQGSLGSALTANLTSSFAKRKSNDALNEMYHRAFHRGSGALLAHGSEGLLPVAPIETGLWGRSSVQAAEALKDLTSWVELVYSSLREMQWVPLGHLHAAVNPETGLPIAQDERVMYHMRNPNKLIEGLALGYQERVMAHLTTLDSFITLRALTPKAQAQGQGNHHAHSQGQGQAQHGHDPSPTHAAVAALYASVAAGTSASASSNAGSGGSNSSMAAAVASGDFWDTFHSQASPRAAASSAAAARAAAARVAYVTPQATAVYEAESEQGASSLQHLLHSATAQASAGGEQCMYELSNVRLVFMDKFVYALVGEDKTETLLGFATFGSVEGKQRFIGFYSMDKEGSIGFQSYAELLTLLPACASATTGTCTGTGTASTDAPAATSTSTSTSTSTTSTTSAGTTTTSTASATSTTTSVENSAALPVVASPTTTSATSSATTSNSTSNSNVTANANTSTTDPNTKTTSSTTSHTTSPTPVDSAEAVQQLLRQITAAELCNAVSLLRDHVSGTFDLSLLQRHWPVGDDTERIYITVE